MSSHIGLMLHSRITRDTVATTLRAIRSGQPLRASPLIALVATLPAFDGSTSNGAVGGAEMRLTQLLADLVAGRLADARGNGTATRRRPHAAADALAELQADFRSNHRPREVWGALQFRYFSGSRLTLIEAADALGVARKTLRRRIDEGHEALLWLVHEEAERVEAARTRIHASSLTRLPEPATRFIGRSAERAGIAALFDRHRLVTLTGIGGIGKSRLAIEVARDGAKRWRDGMAWVALAGPPADHAEAVAITVSVALGVPDPTTSVERTPPVHRRVATWIGARHMLVVLDGCEPAAEGAATFVAAVLAACPAVTFLCSSRVPLGLPAEAVWPVAPMALPEHGLFDGAPTMPADIGDWQGFDGIALFFDRAEAARPGFRLTSANAGDVYGICRSIDGIPLAIELAAATVRALSPGQILARLMHHARLIGSATRDRPAHESAIEAAIRWSIDSLSPCARTLLARLATFSGGWTLDAADTVCTGDDVTPDAMPGLMIELVERALVTLADDWDGHPRYRLLDTVRSCAAALIDLPPHDAEVVRARQLAYYAEAVAGAEHGLRGAEQARWLARIAGDRDNIRAALAWSRASPEHVGAGLRLASGMGRYWQIRGHLDEGRAEIESLLAVSADSPVTVGRAHALAEAGTLARQQGDFAAASAHLEAGRAACHTLGDEAGEAGALRALGSMADDQGDYDGAAEHYRAALACYRRVGHMWGEAAVLNNLGILAFHRGDRSAGRPFLEQSLVCFRTVGDRWAVGVTLFNLANIAVEEDDADGRAEALYTESLTIAASLGDAAGIAGAKGGLAHVYRHRGDLATARRLHRETFPIIRDVGDRQDAAEWLEAMAALDVLEGAHLRAATLFGAASTLREAIDVPLPAKDRAEWDAHRALLESELGVEAFDTAWRAGRRMEWQAAAIDLTAPFTAASMDAAEAPA